MLRLLFPALLALAGCAVASAPPEATAPRTSDMTLMQAFFGEGAQRGVSPVLRCATRCAAP